MSLDAIKDTLSNAQIHLDAVDLDSTYLTFVEESGQENIQAFAEHLHQLQQIDGPELASLLANATVEVAGISQLQKQGPATSTAETASTGHQLLAKIGEGGMGEILLAKDPHLRRPVAYKKLHAHLASNQSILGQFFAEVQITSQLEHPNVVPIYNLEIDHSDTIAYTMKLVQGKSLKELLTEVRDLYELGSPIPESHSQDRLLEYFLKVCNAMEYAHQKGVIHRDLKPANIMIGAYNEVYVLDWGIATLIGKAESNQVLGTPRYMSPEQAGGLNSSLDQQSDLFSLGLILFEVVTLKQAIPKAKDLASVMASIIKGKRNPIIHFKPTVKVAPELQAIIDKATQRRRRDRYASVKDLANDLRRYLRGEAVLARPDTALQKLKRWISQHRQKASALILGLFLTLVSVVGLILYLQNKSTLALQKHQEQLQSALVKVTEKTQELNEKLIDLEILVERLSIYTSHLLDSDPDLRQSAQLPIIFADPSQKRQLAPLIQKLSPLKTRLPQTLQESADPGTEPLPFLSVSIALQEGLTVTYPEQAHPHTDDPRGLPWYIQAKQTGKGAWHSPYRNRNDASIISVPFAQPIVDSQKHFRGVAAVDISSRYIQQHFLNLAAPGILETSIVTQTGEILFGTKNGTGNPGKLDNPKLWEAMQAQRESHYAENGVLYIFCAISSQNWYFLIKADEATFLAGV